MASLSTFLVIALAVAATAQDVIPNCVVPCTREFRPTCGFDGRTHKVFSNPCMLKNEHCKDGHQWFETRMGDCALYRGLEERVLCHIVDFCPRNWDPACGTDGKRFKLFDNPCLVEKQYCSDGTRWVQTRMADCIVECPDDCLQIFAPVCGFNGIEHVMFDNECKMRERNCGVKINRFVRVKTSDCWKANKS